ncbi:TetR/AcrR family transcriptional regulator [Thalassotalea atypica]|uniref:TetR/AcrR family transcriptional regulator n=1 Tax=Thalassotalea atypica TaxID=2054316 RepID=UPI0025730698|nr:TetR/AcrR family transcriptional regulator [Thalassotalea atypica]
MSKTKSKYHHGDLRPSLLNAATSMINEGGVEALSLRKLAEQVGVSRTATYHHFKDKHDLLCAVAAQGFAKWHTIEEEIFNDTSLTVHERYRKFVFSYIEFASQNPAIYDLMFGNTLWKHNQANQALRDIAYPCFQYQVDMTKAWQEKGILPQGEATLRLAQVTWSTMHGMARLIIDGIYADASSIEEMCECAVNLFMQSKV